MEIISWIILRCDLNKEVAAGMLLSCQSQHGGRMGVTKGTISP